MSITKEKIESVIAIVKMVMAAKGKSAPFGASDLFITVSQVVGLLDVSSATDTIALKDRAIEALILEQNPIPSSFSDH